MTQGTNERGCGECDFYMKHSFINKRGDNVATFKTFSKITTTVNT